MSGEVLARVVRAREALADGDVRLARQLLADWEWELRAHGGRSVCPVCRQRFEFPGPRDEHLRVAHPGWDSDV